MEIRTFEPSPDAYARLAELLNAVEPEPPASAAFLERFDAERDPAHDLEREVASLPDSSDRWVGMWELATVPMSTDADRLVVQVVVRPEHRRQGLGSTLWRRIETALAARPVSTLVCQVPEDRDPSIRFLRARGFVDGDRNFDSELPLQAFEPERFADWTARVEARGIALRSLAELTADDPRALEKLYALQLRIHRDVPGMAPPEKPPFEVWSRAFRDNPDLLPDALVIAVDGDRYVGLTQLWASQATDAVLYNGLTGVLRSHRRRGIATALKVRSLGWARESLRASDGTPPVVRTGNEENNPMYRLNVALGFRARRVWLTLVRRGARG